MQTLNSVSNQKFVEGGYQKFVEGGYYLFKTTSREEVYYIEGRTKYAFCCRLYNKNGKYIMKSKLQYSFINRYGHLMTRVKPKGKGDVPYHGVGREA